MLISFSVENFMSIKDKVTLSMETVSDKGSKNSIYPENYQTFSLKENPKKEFKILKSAIIYGANASGKSNLLIGLYRFADFILESYKRGSENIPTMPFLLDTETRDKPATFEAILLIDGIYYRYGFIADIKRIHKEWLFSSNKGRESAIIVREKVEGSLEYNFYKSKYKRLHKEVRDNSLLLTHAALSNDETARLLLSFFKSINFVEHEMINSPKNENNKAILDKMMKSADIGLAALKYEKRDLVKINEMISKLEKEDNLTERNKELVDRLKERLESADDIKFVYEDNEGKQVTLPDLTQSQGTLILLSLLTQILDNLNKPCIFLIDEIEKSLHPHLLSYFFKLFNAISNNQIQIIATTHNPLLLDDGFRRDQIYFTEKGYDNATVLSSASEFTGIRAKKSLFSLYLSGGFGAIPNLSEISIDNIINDMDNVE